VPVTRPGDGAARLRAIADQPDDKPPVDVVMATYNGARFLPEMLASLVAQDWPTLRLIACDDVSNDETVAILESRPDLEVEIHRNLANLGARENFSRALRLARAPYVALADQDDVWLPRKVELMVGRMRELEARHGADRPLLVYSDLQIVDDALTVVVPSYFDDSFKSREVTGVQDFAISNHFPGCAMLVNRALIDLALPVPPRAYMHDWWLCLVAAACGEIGHVHEPLLLFRRHGGNVSGDGRPKQRSDWLLKALARLRNLRSYLPERYAHSSEVASQANIHLADLVARYAGHMPAEAHRRLKELRSRSWLRRWRALSGGHSGESAVTNVLVAIAMGWKHTQPDIAGVPSRPR